MSGYKTDQLHVIHRVRSFHFVSYEGKHADPAKSVVAVPPTWFLMSAGKRWEVMTQFDSEVAGDIEAHLVKWLEDNVFPLGDEAPAAVMAAQAQTRLSPPEVDATLSPRRSKAKRHYR